MTSDISDAELDAWIRIDSNSTVRIFRILTERIWDWAFRLRSYGQEHIPESGAFVFVPNHASYLDPFLQVRGQRRLVRFMAKAQLFDLPLIRSIVKSGGGFPVRRGAGDQFAMTLAHRLLEDGQPVCVYAEGTRFRTDAELGPSRSGAARLALSARVPVVPVASWGNKPRAARGESWWPPRLPRVTTLYGPVMHFEHLDETPENVAFVRDAIWREVHRLHDLARELTSRRRRPRTFAVPAAPTASSRS